MASSPALRNTACRGEGPEARPAMMRAFCRRHGWAIMSMNTSRLPRAGMKVNPVESVTTLPFEDTPYQPDITVPDLIQLASALLDADRSD